MNLVSIIIPVYNNERFLKESIYSISKINYTNIEIIIIDDCSTDNSIEIIKLFQKMDKRIRFFKNENNLGTAKTLKEGVKRSKGDYIFFAAGDDISLPDRVDKCLRIFEQNGKIGIIVSNAIIIDENGRETGDSYSINDNIQNFNINLEQFKRNYCLGATMAIVNDKSILLKEGMLEHLDDYEITLEYILNNYDIFLLRDFLVKYRIHNSNQSNNSRCITEKAKAILKKYKDEDILHNLKLRGYKNKDIYITLGISNLFKDDIKKAYEYLSFADSINYEVYNSRIIFENKFYLGIVNYKLGNIKESLLSFQEVYSFNKRNPALLNNLAVLIASMKEDKNAAKKMLKLALEIYPDYIDAKNNLNSLVSCKSHTLKITERILDVQIYKRNSYVV